MKERDMKKLLGFGPLFIIIAALLWSFDGLLRINLYSLSPSVIVFYEHLLGAFFLLLFLPRWLPDLSGMKRKEWFAIGVVSLFSGALGTIFYTAALGKVQFTRYSVVVLLQQQLQPIWAIGAASIILKEKITKKFLLWTGIALIAAYFISFRDLQVNLNTGTETITAALFALTAGLMWGTSTAISKYVLKKVSFLTGTTLRFFLAPLFAFLIILAQNQVASLTQISFYQWQTLFLITLSTGLVALGFYYYGLKKTPARITTLLELVWPASAILIDYFLFKKALSATQILGVILLLLAIYQITRRQKYSGL